MKTTRTSQTVNHIQSPFAPRVRVLAGLILTTVFGSMTVLSALVPVPANILPERIPGAKPRNVVFILSDDHRYDAMSFLGHQFAKTPVMDSLAANGAYIKNALVTTALCSPSRPRSSRDFILFGIG